MTILISIGILAVLYIVIGLFLPSTTTIANSLKMSGSGQSIYESVSDFKNWNEWAIWNEDNCMSVRISDPSKGTGARYRWKAKIREIKDGLIVLKDAQPNFLLNYTFHYGKRQRGEILFNIEELEDGGSFVTCAITINNKRKIFGRYFALLIKKPVIENIEDVLLKIDDFSKFNDGRDI